MKPLNVIFAGTPDFAARHLQALIDSEHNVIAVYTQPDRPAGRGKKLQASPVKALALENDIAVYQPKSLRDEDAQAELAALNADIMVVVAYGLILPKVVLDPEGTSLNTQLLKFQLSKERIGIVVDEYGDIQGLVTLEDILEEVVGDFTTTQTRTPSEEVTTQNDGSYIVDGGANVRDLNKEMGWEFPLDGPKTLSGLIVEYLEDIPDANLSIRIAGYPVEVLEIKENMIKQVKIQPNKRKK